MSRFYILLAFLLIGVSTLQGQGRRYRYIGLQPGASLEIVDPYYPVESFDINVLPFVFQTPINTVTDFKLTTIGIYRYDDAPRLSAVGFEVVFPRFFKAKERFSEKSQGWYLAPLASGRRDFYRNLWETRGALEFGRYSEAKGAFAFTFNLQAGGAYQFHPNRKPSIVPYAGINLGIGFWVKQKVFVRGGSV